MEWGWEWVWKWDRPGAVISSSTMSTPPDYCEWIKSLHRIDVSNIVNDIFNLIRWSIESSQWSTSLILMPKWQGQDCGHWTGYVWQLPYIIVHAVSSKMWPFACHCDKARPDLLYVFGITPFDCYHIKYAIGTVWPPELCVTHAKSFVLLHSIPLLCVWRPNVLPCPCHLQNILVYILCQIRLHNRTADTPRNNILSHINILWGPLKWIT